MAGFFLGYEMGDQITWFIVGSMALIVIIVIIDEAFRRRASRQAKKEAHERYMEVIAKIEDRVRIDKIRPASAPVSAPIHSRIQPSINWWEEGFGGVQSHGDSSSSRSD